MAPRDEVPARRVDADLVDELVERHDVAGALGHLGQLARPDQVDDLVQEHLDSLGVVAEHSGDSPVPVPRAVVVGAEHVDRPLEAAPQLVVEVGDVGGAIGRQAVRADHDLVLVVAVGRGTGPDRAVLLVRVNLGQQLGHALLQLALERPGAEVDPEALERCLVLRQDGGYRIALDLRQLLDVRAAVAVLRSLPAFAHRLDGGPEELHLPARVVVVVLALDVVPGELEQPGDGVAVGAVAGGGDDDRARRVRGDHLDLDVLAPFGLAAAVAASGPEDLRERLAVPVPAEPEVDEPRAGDLGALDLRQRRGPLRQFLRQLARGLPLRRSELQRGVRRVVAVLGLARPFELDAGACEARERRFQAGQRSSGQRPGPA